MITMKKIFCVWPSAIEGGVDKDAPTGEKCLEEKILKKLGRNKSGKFYKHIFLHKCHVHCTKHNAYCTAHALFEEILT